MILEKIIKISSKYKKNNVISNILDGILAAIAGGLIGWFYMSASIG